MDDLDAVRDARLLLARARETLRAITARVPALAATMRWRSRAAVEFGEVLAQWHEVLQRADSEIDAWEARLARHEGEVRAG